MHLLSNWRSLNLILIWAFASGLSAGLGAFIAVLTFPEAGFGQNHIGVYNAALFAFACLIGLALGSTQYLVLRKIFLYYSRSVDAWLLSWIPATAIGIVILIIPLSYFDANALLREPLLPALIMLPGASVLGIGQWFILRQYGISGDQYRITGVAWIIRTAIGVLLGASLGLIAAFFIFGFAYMASGLIEPVWASFVGLGLGLFQGDFLARKLTGQGAPRWLMIVAIMVLVLILPIALTIYFFFASWIH